MSELNCSFSNLINTTFSLAERDSAFTENACSSVFSLDSNNVSENISESFSKKSATASIDFEKFFNSKTDSGILDSVNNKFEGLRLIDCDGIVKSFSECSGVMSSDFIEKVMDTEMEDNFCNGFQFNDQPLINFSENLNSSTIFTEPLRFKSSLYKNFDPLYSKFLPDFYTKSTESRETAQETNLRFKLSLFKNFDPLYSKFLPDFCTKSTESREIAQETLRLKSSLFKKFDPLYSKVLPDFYTKSTDSREIAQETNLKDNNAGISLSSDNIGETKCNKLESNPDLIQLEPNKPQVNISNTVNLVPAIIRKSSSGTFPMQSFETDLISFDLPNYSDSNSLSFTSCDFEKKYSEEELQQALKVQELTFHEKYLRKQQELKEMFSKRQQELREELKRRKIFNDALRLVIKETADIALSLADKETLMKNRLKILENENKDLKLEINKSREDLQNIENAFSKLYRSYEQGKNLLNVCIENERNLMQQLEQIKLQLREKEIVDLPSEIQAQLGKYNTELAMVRKAVDDQKEVLEEKLQQAELNIFNIESNLKSLKTENEKLNFTYNDLISKVHM